MQQFKTLRRLLNDHKGNKRKTRFKSFKNIKIFCQTFGEIYDEIQGCLSYCDLRNLRNHIFTLRTNLWKEVHYERSGNNLVVRTDFKMSENTKKLVDGIIKFLDELNEVVDFANQSFYCRK